MALPASGQISINDINVEFGRSGTTANSSLEDLSDGTVATINTANASADRPDGSAPHSMTEFYSYDHDLASTSWSSPPADFTMSGVNGGTEISGLKTISLTGGSGNTTISRTTTGSPAITFQGAFSTSGDPGTGANFFNLPEIIAHTSGTLYCRFKCIHQPNKDGTGTVTLTFTNNGVTNNDCDITINFGGGGPPLP
jgi:hypothetical protein